MQECGRVVGESKTSARWIGLMLSLGLATVGFGCGPKYPNCEGDKDCREKEFCVNGKCQQCRPGKQDCPEGQECVAGACKPIAGYCTSHEQCPPDQSCIDHRCKPCVADDQCGEGKCHNGRCQPKNFCVTDADCPQDQDCIQGRCTTPTTSGGGPAPCALETVYFDFNESALTTNATEVLQKDATCLKESSRSVALEAHADPRGTEEYNLALSDRRAQSVKRYLTNLGVSANRMRTVPKGKTEATGTDEAGWAKDRRVDLEWQ